MKKIWEKMSLEQRRKLLGYIIVDGYAAGTAYAFCEGARIPRPCYWEKIRGYVLEITGKDVPEEKLFKKQTGAAERRKKVCETQAQG